MKTSCRHHLVFIFALLAFSILFVLTVATEVAAASPDTTEVAAASPDTSDNAGQAAAPAEGYYDVWFDGTLGMNKLIDYKGRAGCPPTTTALPMFMNRCLPRMVKSCCQRMPALRSDTIMF